MKTIWAHLHATGRIAVPLRDFHAAREAPSAHAAPAQPPQPPRRHNAPSRDRPPPARPRPANPQDAAALGGWLHLQRHTEDGGLVLMAKIHMVLQGKGASANR